MTDETLRDLAERAVRLLREKGLTVATAESCTGGLIAKLITDVSGASEVFHCGVVSYANDVKHALLGVREETLDEFGAVSEQTVLEMEAGVRKLAKADVGVAVSGIAGPNADGTRKPVGLIWLCCGTAQGSVTFCMHNTFPADVRENNRRAAADRALRMVIEAAEKKQPTGGETHGK